MALKTEYILTLQQLKGVGTKTIMTFAEQAGCHIETLDELLHALQKSKVKKLQALTSEDISEANQAARRLIEWSEADNIGVIGYYDEDFPQNLRQTVNEEGKIEPPVLLWYKGDLSLCRQPGLAVIGTREVTPEGKAGGEYLACEFAQRDINIISGLAIGCDTCGHVGALKCGGKTTAILANGLDYKSIYPAENRALAERIVENGGLLLSEYPIGATVKAYNLVARDRLQSALAQATLVIQTGIKGGTMHAANTTLLAGKPLYAMKFKDDRVNNHEKCLGNAYLVQQGAKYISGTDDLDAISEDIKVLS